jgi:hypothetical protein
LPHHSSLRSRFTRALARVAVTTTILASAVALTPAVPASAEGDTDAAAPAAGGVCQCGAIGDFVEPDDGVLARVVYTSPREGTSPGGRYDLVAGDSSTSIYRGADRTRPLLTLATVSADYRWGFSPDQDRFATWWIDSNRLFGYALYDLSASGGAKQIAGESSLTRISSANLAFSRSGSRFLVGYLGDATAMTLKTFDARTGEQQFGENLTIQFPPSDPGGGGAPGASSPPENFEVSVVKDQPLFDVTWDPPHYIGDGAVTGYELTSDPEAPAGAGITEVGERHLRLNGFTPGVRYTFSLRLKNPAGLSAAAESSKVKIPLPKPPKDAFADSATQAAELDASAAVSSAAWGFSPDDDDRYLMLSTVENGFTRVRIVDLETGDVTLEERVTAASATWGFSPCGEAFGFILSPPTGAKDVKVLSTSTGEQIGTTQKATGRSVRLGVYGEGEQGRLSYLLIVDDKATLIARASGESCGEPDPDPGENPPAAAQNVTAIAGMGRAAVTWEYPADGAPVDLFEVQVLVDGKESDAVTVDGARRSAQIGSGGSPVAAGDYSFVVVAHRGDVSGPPSAATSAVTVGVPAACGLVTWSTGPLTGAAEGIPTAGGVTASLQYSINGTAVTVRDTSTRSGTGRPASTLDAGAPTWTYEHDANSTQSREHVAYLPGWNDYLVTVEARDADGGVSLASAVVHVAPLRAPANDAFAKATTLSGTGGDLAGASTWTTCESTEPGTDDGAVYTQWFEITPETDARLVIEGYHPAVNIYSGDALESLTEITQQLGRWPDLLQSASLDAGVRYHVQIAAEAASPDFSMPWQLYPAPPNDDRADATVIDPTSEAEHTVDLNGAGVQPGETNVCESCTTVASVWFTWTATSHEWVTVYSEDPLAALEFFVADPDAPLGVSAVDATWKKKEGHKAGIEQQPGTTYYVRISDDAVDHLANGPVDPFPVTWHPAPHNDYIADAQTVEGASGAVDGSNRWSYLEYFTGIDAEVRSGVVWYRWHAERSGPMSFTVDTDEIARPEVYVFDDDPADPTLLAPTTVQTTEDDPRPRTTFDAVAGTSYLLAVSGHWTGGYYGPLEGDFTLRWGEATLPGAPQSVVAEELPGTDSLSVEWEPADDGNADLLGYLVSVTPELPAGGTIAVDDEHRSAVVRGTAPGETYTVHVAAQNVLGRGPAAASQPVTTASGPRISIERLGARVGDPFEYRLTVSGGTAPFTFELVGAPGWLRLDSTSGVLSGTPDAAGSSAATVRVTDSDGRTSTSLLPVDVVPVDPGSEDPDPEPKPDDSPSTIAGDPVPGGTLTASLTGFAAGSSVDVWLHSTPLPLGTVVADASGVAHVTFVVPREFRGEHRVEGIGFAPDGSPHLAVVSFVIDSGDDGPLAVALGATGAAGILSWTAAGLLLLGGGFVATLIVRRRQRG